MGHKVASCPELGKAKSDEKPKVKEARAVITTSVEPLPARKLEYLLSAGNRVRDHNGQDRDERFC